MVLALGPGPARLRLAILAAEWPPWAQRAPWAKRAERLTLAAASSPPHRMVMLHKVMPLASPITNAAIASAVQTSHGSASPSAALSASRHDRRPVT
jgi:hypothetical protein